MKTISAKYVVCVHNEGYPVSLSVRKVYRTIPGGDEPDLGLVRVVVESGEDYLYPMDWFVPVEFTEEGERALSATA